MAKVNGPLMSVSASGAFANRMVFASWKGRPYVRNLVTPSNPNAADQEAARNRVRCAGAAQRFANHCALEGDGRTGTDKVLLTFAAPSGQAWNGFLVKSMIGSLDAAYTAAAAIWTALSGGEKTTWDNAAAALTPAIPAVAQTQEGGESTTAMTAGQVFLHYTYGLYAAGVGDIPTATPPTYA